MSFTIIKAGICDTFQDEGRKGLQHLGINPGGAMDTFAMHSANYLVGNDNCAVLEMHFPAATILIEQDCLIAITGADFVPEVNDIPIPLLQPVCIPAGSKLQFRQRRRGTWCYLAVHGGFILESWLDSYSTHVKSGAGGWQGRALKKGDRIPFHLLLATPSATFFSSLMTLPWGAMSMKDPAPVHEAWIMVGPETHLLNEQSKAILDREVFAVLPASDRMAYSLSGPDLTTVRKEQMVSSAVVSGTVQLLPDGQLMVLMADHQTTGGYPRIGQVVQAHLSKLAQCRPGDRIQFRLVSQEQARLLWLEQYTYLNILKLAAKFKIESLKLQS